MFPWQVYTCSIWGGLYATDNEKATPKRHILFSNDEELLKRLQAAAGHASKAQLQAMQGPSLVCQHVQPDGTRTFSGSAAMKSSQFLGCTYWEQY